MINVSLSYNSLTSFDSAGPCIYPNPTCMYVCMHVCMYVCISLVEMFLSGRQADNRFFCTIGWNGRDQELKN